MTKTQKFRIASGRYLEVSVSKREDDCLVVAAYASDEQAEGHTSGHSLELIKIFTTPIEIDDLKWNFERLNPFIKTLAESLYV